MTNLFMKFKVLIRRINMLYDKIIRGNYINLRSVIPSDAAVTLSMRLDKEKTKYLHPVKNDINLQTEWIKKQNDRNGDYFFLAINKENVEVGTFGIDSIKGDVGHSGRLLMYGNAIESMEVNILVFRFAFEFLKLSCIEGDVDSRNMSAIRLDKEFGFVFQEAIYDNELNRMAHYCSLSKEDFYAKLEKINRLVYRNKSIPIMPWEIA